MFNIVREEIEWGGRPLVMETGRIARQADGAVLITYGETIVLCTAVGVKKASPDIDFLPLTVHYQEKAFAAGKIPGGFVKREGRPSEFETLSSRLIDRPIRPLFPEGFHNEIQIVCTVMSHDLENMADIVAMIGASAALSISGIPFQGPIAGVRVGYKNGEFILNPLLDEIKDSDLELLVAGTKEGILMVESEAKELSEEIMLGAVMFGHQACQPVIDMINKLKEKAGKPVWESSVTSIEDHPVYKKIEKAALKEVKAAYKEKEKLKRYATLDAIAEKLTEEFVNDDASKKDVLGALEHLKYTVMRDMILSDGVRVDGRDTKTIRPILGEVGVLPRAHGSALFTRGETQAFVVTTLGTGQDEQLIDALEGEYKERFMLHYNAPSYSVGEVGRMSSPGRREIGHGKLAWRAIRPVFPNKEAFPYTIRVVAEITEMNGSSSMATVCGSSLALMDAGVPLVRPVAGIAMGLIKEGDKFSVLSDILGDEDHLGDMDFKVTGTEKGVTALQMDIKITSINEAIMKQALSQAKDGRIHILGEMNKALGTAREELNGNAPRIVTFTIPKEKIREVIGTGGKVIREIVEVTGVKIDIEDEGTVKVAGSDPEKMEEAIAWIRSIALDPAVGDILDVEVVRLADFGAFVSFWKGRDGLVHVSELEHKRVEKVSDVVKLGDKFQVKVIGIEEKGKIRLSRKALIEKVSAEQAS